MGKIKSLLVGAGIAAFNIGTAFFQVFKPERCTGSCASCGLSCVQPVVGIAGVGIAVVLFKKFKGKFKRQQLT